MTEAFLKKYPLINEQTIEDGIYTLKTIAEIDESSKAYTDILIKVLTDRNNSTHVQHATCFIISEQYNRKNITKNVYKEYLNILYRNRNLLETIIGSVFPNAIKNVLSVVNEYNWTYPDTFAIVAHPLSYYYFLKMAYEKTDGLRTRAAILSNLCENITSFASKVNNIVYVKLFEIKKGRSLFMDIFDVSDPHISRLAKSKFYNVVLHYKHRDYVDRCM